MWNQEELGEGDSGAKRCNCDHRFKTVLFKTMITVVKRAVMTCIVSTCRGGQRRHGGKRCLAFIR